MYFNSRILIVVCSKMCLRAQYLHLAILMSIGEDVAVDVSERRNPGENRRINRHICRLQLSWGIDVCGLKVRVSHIL